MESKDAVLKQVQAAIEREAHIDLKYHPVALGFVDGSVSLDGELPDVAAKKLAVNAAAHVPGVRGVVDRLRVCPGERPGDGATRDAVCKQLLRDIDFQNCTLDACVKGQAERLREAGNNSSGAILVSVADGVVALSGQVISLSHKRLAGVLAWWARGSRDVVNELKVVPAEEDNDDEIADALRLVLESDPHVHADQIGISSHDRVVTLDGVVASDRERKRAEMDAWYLFAVDKVVNHLEVR
jgi:osmotically-inducible protein OsmY